MTKCRPTLTNGNWCVQFYPITAQSPQSERRTMWMKLNSQTRNYDGRPLTMCVVRTGYVVLRAIFTFVLNGIEVTTQQTYLFVIQKWKLKYFAIQRNKSRPAKRHAEREKYVFSFVRSASICTIRFDWFTKNQKNVTTNNRREPLYSIHSKTQINSPSNLNFDCRWSVAFLTNFVVSGVSSQTPSVRDRVQWVRSTWKTNERDNVHHFWGQNGHKIRFYVFR